MSSGGPSKVGSVERPIGSYNDAYKDKLNMQYNNSSIPYLSTNWRKQGGPIATVGTKSMGGRGASQDAFKSGGVQSQATTASNVGNTSMMRTRIRTQQGHGVSKGLHSSGLDMMPRQQNLMSNEGGMFEPYSQNSGV